MNVEILFRGKRISDGTWVYGGIIKTFHPNYDNKSFADFENQTPNCYCICANGCDYFVEQESIGQFTGLLDKNRKKIFKDDLLRVYGKIYRVGYDMGDCVCTNINNPHDSNRIRFILLHVDEKQNGGEIIGNIHDNPELLKGGHDAIK